MKVICDAVPFGFGPVAKLIAIARVLPGEKIFVGSDCSLALAKTAGCFTQVIEANTMSPDGEQVLAETLMNCDAAISVMNPDFAEFVIRHGVPLVIVDSLFSIWDVIPPSWHQAQAVIFQRFQGVAERVEREFNRPNLRIVGPIIDPLVKKLGRGKNSSGTLLINLGGAEDPISVEKFLCARAVRQLLSGLPVLDGFDRKILTIGPRQKEELLPLGQQGIEVTTLDHSSFLRELAAADLVCSTPGLTATFEAFALGTPCVFLPPFNYSQFLNLLTFRSVQVAPHSLHWLDWDIGRELDRGMEEGLAVRTLEGLIASAIQDSTLMEAMHQKLAGMLCQAVRPAQQSALTAAQGEYFKLLGGVGTEEASQYIIEVLRG